MKSEDGAVQRGRLMYDSAARADSCCTISRVGDFVHSCPYDIRPPQPYRKQEASKQGAPNPRIGKRRCTRWSRVSSWPRTERCDTRSHGARGGDAAHRAPSPCAPCRGCFASAGKKLLSIVGSARRACGPAPLRQLGRKPGTPASAPACPELTLAPQATPSTAGRRPTCSLRTAGAASTSLLCARC
jgi:hypothetical protein